MLLKYLDIQGFKSFPDKTRVTFDRGLTAVVGPNGSGKSNISDAVRWVMGEQSTKTLRGSKMEDVIFSGTKTRKPQGYAEVSLTVDNSKREFAINSDEVTITRKYYRSGESEYMINRSNVRLKDINELFMDTGLGKDGYSLVGQGKIAEIIQSKSNERREIFEEATGISKFRYKKNEAEKNLDNAEENLVRLRDILAELQVRVEPLRIQSEKAKTFLDLADRKRTVEVSIWNNTIEHSNQLLKDQSDKVLIATNQKEELEEGIEKIEQNIQETFRQMQQCLILIDQKRENKEQLESQIANLTSQIAVCENDIQHNLQNATRIDLEIENYNKSIENTENEVKLKQDKIDEIKNKIDEIEQDIIKKQDELFSNTTESENASKKQHELSEQMNKLLLEQSQVKMTIAQLTMNIDELNASIARNDIEYKARVEELEKYKQEKESATEFMTQLNEKLETLNNTYNGHKLKLENKLSKLEQIKSECEKSNLLMKEKQQKVDLLVGLENSLEGFAYSVKEVLKRAKNSVLSGVYGTVSQIVNVKAEYSVAIETALSSTMQNIIVDNESNAKSAIKLLKNEKLGRATFLPLTSVKGKNLNVQGLEQYSGYINVASNLVEYEQKFQPIINSLLGRIIIVDDIDTAVLIAQKYGYKFKIVTLDGQVVNAGGSLTGGSRNKSQGFLSRKNDIKSLKKELSSLSKTYNEKIENMKVVQSEVSKIQAEFTAINSEIRTISEDKIRLEAEIKRLEHMITQSIHLNDVMEEELSNKKSKINSNEAELDIKSSEIKNIEKDINSVSLELSKIEITNKGSVETQTKLGNQLGEMKIKVVEYKKDIEATLIAIDELNRQSKTTDERAKNLLSDKNSIFGANKEIENQIVLINKNIDLNKSEIQTINKTIDETMQKRQQLEGETTTLRRSERELTEKKEKVSAEIIRLQERHMAIQKEYDEIIAKLWDEYELTRSESQKIALNIEDISRANSELIVLKSKIRNLGNVNVSAIDEYKEVSLRYEFLSAQVEDAEKSRNELLKLIQELTQKMQDIFSENFKKINENFKDIFVELFGGGRAELKLTEPDNLLESGIEIFVEPPGKIIKNLAALSGGEQSFVAIAIYFAILKVRPAPFCILDEIEAALDDVNVIKYSNYLRSLSDKTQFIMITHRRGSMEAADVLYGVTMQDEGVSKLLRLKVSEIEKSKILAQ